VLSNLLPKGQSADSVNEGKGYTGLCKQGVRGSNPSGSTTCRLVSKEAWTEKQLVATFELAR
jgi:hypothetical protein